jgi:hypothetical protein
MRHRVAARFTTALALVAASLFWGPGLFWGPVSPAAAAVDGFDVSVGQQPGTFTIGKAARTLTAVATTDRERRCRKVRWSLTIRTEGVSLDQLRINRVENGGSFRVRTQVSADEARFLDAQVDPGQLCRGQTVTGRWDVAFAGPDSGTVTFEASALDVGGRELASTSTTSRVVSPVAATPSATPSATETAAPDDGADDQAAADDQAPAGADESAAALNPAAGTPSVLGPGLIIGAVLVFVGVALLLRLRTRNRRDPAWQTETQMLPTGFYNAPRRKQGRRR